MKKDYNLLILGFFNNVYIANLVKNLKRVNPDAHIYYWGYRGNTLNEIGQAYKRYCDECYFHEDRRRFANIPVLRKVESIYLYRKGFKKFVRFKHFDVVNIHFALYKYVFIIDVLKRVSSKIVISPWGSDVFYVKGFSKFLLRILYAEADFVTVKRETAFGNECLKKFCFSPNKLYPFTYFGSETIDYILENINIINNRRAKELLGFEDSYIITCGYKGEPGQQHIKIIEAINQVRKQLPENLLLFFPFTYGGTVEYKQSVKHMVNEYHLNAVFFEEFVGVEKLFLIRRATDMYIHTLIDDAGGASLKEYLLCTPKVIKGGWLLFNDLDSDENSPYFITNTMEDLGQSIAHAFNAAPIVYSESVQGVLEKKGWKSAINTWDEFYSKIS